MVKKFWWVFLVAAPMLSISLAAFRVYHAIAIWEYQGPEIVFEVKSGEPFSSINARLAKRDIITSTKVFYRYSKYHKLMTSFKSGHYKIKPRSTMLDIIDQLVKGQAITTKVTIPEGKNLFEIGKILESKGIVSYENFVKAARDLDLLRRLKVPGKTAEGYLYPETYQFAAKSHASEVIASMVHVYNKKIANYKLEQNPLALTPNQVIIMASVVEKETGAGHERPIIAGVFYNRLKKKMRLQSDPTTIYGIFEKFDGNLKKRHLLQKTPYNTYKISGLPQGPISNPGLESIRAVLNPNQHNYLYFVSQNDGTHVFSETYKQHLRAVNQYQKDYRARSGKSWRNLQKTE